MSRIKEFTLPDLGEGLTEGEILSWLVTVLPGRTTRAVNSGGAESATSPFSQYRRLGSKNTIGSSDAIACWIMWYPSDGFAHVTTLRPGVCAKYASGDSEWCSTAPMPPPNGILITTGRCTLPCER